MICYLCKEEITKNQSFAIEEGMGYWHANDKDCRPTKCIRCGDKLFTEYLGQESYFCYDCHTNNLKIMIKALK